MAAYNDKMVEPIDGYDSDMVEPVQEPSTQGGGHDLKALNEQLLNQAYEHPSLKEQGQLVSHHLSKVPLAGPALQYAGAVKPHPDLAQRYPQTSTYTGATLAAGASQLPVPPWYRTFPQGGVLGGLGRTATAVGGDVAIKAADMGVRQQLLGESSKNPGGELAETAAFSAVPNVAINQALPLAGGVYRKFAGIASDIHNTYKARHNEINDVGKPMKVNGVEQGGRERLIREMDDAGNVIRREEETARSETAEAKQRLKESKDHARDQLKVQRHEAETSLTGLRDDERKAISSLETAHKQAKTAEDRAFAAKEHSIKSATVPLEAAEKVIESKGIVKNSVQSRVAEAWKSLEDKDVQLDVRPLLTKLRAKMDRYISKGVPPSSNPEYAALNDVYKDLHRRGASGAELNTTGIVPKARFTEDGKVINDTLWKLGAKDTKTFIDQLKDRGIPAAYSKAGNNQHINPYERALMGLREEMNGWLYEIPEFAKAMGGTHLDVKAMIEMEKRLGHDAPAIRQKLGAINFGITDDPAFLALEQITRKSGLDPLEHMKEYVAAQGIKRGGKPAMQQVRDSLPEGTSVKDTLKALEAARIKQNPNISAAEKKLQDLRGQSVKESSLPEYDTLQDYLANQRMVSDLSGSIGRKRPGTMINNNPENTRFDPEILDQLRALDKYHGANNLGHIPFEQRAKDLKVYEYLNREGANGSRRVMGAKGLIGGPASVLLGKLGMGNAAASAAGEALSASAGLGGDMDSRKVYKFMMDLALDPKNAARLKTLNDALAKGTSAFALAVSRLEAQDDYFRQKAEAFKP